MVYDEIPISHPVSSMEVDKEYIYLMGEDQVCDPLVLVMDFVSLYERIGQYRATFHGRV